MFKVRSISEILKEADSADTPKNLVDLWNEVASNKKQYPICEVLFSIEHISDLMFEKFGYHIEFKLP